MNIKPLGDYVVIEPFKKEEVTESGFILATNDKEKPEKGRVIRLGHDAENMVPVNSIVYFKQYSGDTIEVDKKEYIVLHVDALMCYEV